MVSKLGRARRGQASTEWMLLISVVVIAVVAAGYGLVRTFGAGMGDLADGAGTIYNSGALSD